MSQKTGISWCDATFNPWWGCSKVSPACDHCYAERDARRYEPGHALWGIGAQRRTFGDAHWNEPLRWARAMPGKLNRRPRVFCASMADVFDKDAPAEDRVSARELEQSDSRCGQPWPADAQFCRPTCFPLAHCLLCSCRARESEQKAQSCKARRHLPQRIQLSRRKGWRMPPNTISVARPTIWGNPFRVGMLGVPDRATAVELFKRALQRQDIRDDHGRFAFAPERISAILRGKNLACWCPIGEPCHGDVLLHVANSEVVVDEH